MYISLSTRTFDPNGSIIIDADLNDSDLQNYVRRGSRTKTLDGGATIIDGGHSHADRTITITANLSKPMAEKLRYIFQHYPEINLSLPDGYYKASMRNLRDKFGKISLTIWIESKLSETETYTLPTTSSTTTSFTSTSTSSFSSQSTTTSSFSTQSTESTSSQSTLSTESTTSSSFSSQSSTSTLSSLSTTSSSFSSQSTTSSFSSQSTTSSSLSSQSSVSTTSSSFSSQSSTSSLSSVSTTSSSFSSQSSTSTLSSVSTTSSSLSTLSSVSTTSSSFSSQSSVSTTSSQSSQSTLSTTSSSFSSQSSTSSLSTTTTATCAYNDNFIDLNYWKVFTQSGGGTATIDTNQLKIYCPNQDSAINILYKYEIPAGDFDYRIDLISYTPGDASDAGLVQFRVRDNVYHNRIDIRYNEESGTPILQAYWEINDGGFVSGTVYNNTPEIVRIVRDGNYLKAYGYYNSQWNLLDSVDFDTYASEIDRLDILGLDQSNYGMTAILDNLELSDGCPSGSSVIWTTTTTSMTTTTTTEPPA